MPFNYPLGQRRSRKAIAVLELAMVSPVLVAMIFGTVEVSRVLHVNQVLSDACRAADRLAVQRNVSAQDVTNCAQKILLANNIASGNVAISIQGTLVSSLLTAQEGDDIAVTVTVPASSVGYITPLFVSANTLLRSTIVMRRQK